MHQIDVTVVPGATLKGFGKRQNTTLNLTEKILNGITEGDVVVLAFGQVDIELGYYYTNVVKQHSISYQDFITECLIAYQQLIDNINTTFNACKVIIKGVNPPVLVDKQKGIRYTKRIITENLTSPEEIRVASNRLKGFFTDISMRSEISMYLNTQLELFAHRNHLRYFDVFEQTTYSNGLVKEEFIPTKFDHHLIDSILVRRIHWLALKRYVLASE